MAPMQAGARRGGFTLMEMLVTLMLISFASMLMFQMLGSYRVAKERTMAQSGALDRQALFAAWFRDSVRGMYADQDAAFKGDARALTGHSLNAAYLTTGIPVESAWTLAPGAGERDWQVEYAEDGQVRWTLVLAFISDARFVYLDEKGKAHDAWPPRLGESLPLPAAVALVRKDLDGKPMPSLVAAVRGARKPLYRPFELEQE